MRSTFVVLAVAASLSLTVACGSDDIETCATAELSCGAHGVCTDRSGTPACACNMGYDGASCGTCAAGYQDNDGDGVCLQNCATADLSCGTGTCNSTSGAATCVCKPGQAGADCTLCDHGYQDNDGDGACAANCVTAALACGANGVCSDVSGLAACACAPGYGGASCATCAAGYQDDDGDGTCAATCADATWWDAAYLNRVALTYTNDTSEPLAAGTPIRVVFDHAAQVTAGHSIASGNDVRVVRYNANTNIEVVRFAATWNDARTEVVFALGAQLAPGATTTAYWLYWNHPAATAPTSVYAPPAHERIPVAVDDGSTLACERRTGGFLSIQLRQLGRSHQYEIYANEHTQDPGLYAKLQVVDDDTAVAIVTKQYTELGGTCCSPVVDGNTADTVTINATRFTVTLETKEFSGTARFLGCNGSSTSNPTQVGTTQRQYEMTTVPYRRADMCGL